MILQLLTTAIQHMFETESLRGADLRRNRRIKVHHSHLRLRGVDRVTTIKAVRQVVQGRLAVQEEILHRMIVHLIVLMLSQAIQAVVLDHVSWDKGQKSRRQWGPISFE